MKYKIKLNALLGKPVSPYQKFHELTKFKRLYPMLPVEKWPKSWTTTYFKDYPRLDKIILPEPVSMDNMLWKDALWNRHSRRAFSNQPLTLEQLSSLLYYSAGLRNNIPPWSANRFYASPGARYTLEVYIISLNSELPKGIFHYNLRTHSLETLLLKKVNAKSYFNQDWVFDASVIILLTTTFSRNTIKYGERGYRHIMQEAGHLGQNFYLNAAVLDLSICAIGGYVENKLDYLLDIDSQKESVIYTLAVGNKKKKGF